MDSRHPPDSGGSQRRKRVKRHIGSSARTRSFPRPCSLRERADGLRAPRPGRPARGGRIPCPRLRRRRRRRRPRPRAGPSSRVRSTRHRLAAGVLGDVREQFRDDVERGRLDRLGQPLGREAVDLHRHVARPASAWTAGVEPAVGEDRRMDPAGELAELLQAECELVARPRQQFRRAGRVVGEPRLGQAKPESERDQPLLCAVVQVPLEPSALGVAGLDDARSRCVSTSRASAFASATATRRVNFSRPPPRRAGIAGAADRDRGGAPEPSRDHDRGGHARAHVGGRPCAPGRRGARSPGRSAPSGRCPDALDRTALNRPAGADPDVEAVVSLPSADELHLVGVVDVAHGRGRVRAEQPAELLRDGVEEPLRAAPRSRRRPRRG